MYVCVCARARRSQSSRYAVRPGFPGGHPRLRLPTNRRRPIRPHPRCRHVDPLPSAGARLVLRRVSRTTTSALRRSRGVRPSSGCVRCQRAPWTRATPSSRSGRGRWRQCALCLSAFLRGDTIRVLPCRHAFLQVVDRWLIGMCAHTHRRRAATRARRRRGRNGLPPSPCSHTPEPLRSALLAVTAVSPGVSNTRVSNVQARPALSRGATRARSPLGRPFTRSIPGRLAGARRPPRAAAGQRAVACTCLCA